MKIIPAKNRLLLEELKPDDMPHSGIALAQSAQVGSTTAYRIVATATTLTKIRRFIYGEALSLSPPVWGLKSRQEGNNTWSSSKKM